MTNRLPAALPLLLLLLPLAARAQTDPPGFSDVELVTGLSMPTALAMTPDGRLLIAERTGAIRVWDHGTLLPSPMLTLAVETYEEQGVIGMALDPQFGTRPYLYVFYTPYTGAQPAPLNRISRFIVNGDSALVRSETVLLDSIPTGVGFHQGGGLVTSPDGRLWIGIGDVGDVSGATEWPNNLEGKLLRLDLDGSIPADNPFAGVAGDRGEVWQMGLRNPFRFAIQPGTLQPFVDDVGQNLWEEIDVGPPGANFGWPTCEGPVDPPPPGITNPLYAYPHDSTHACITAGVFQAGTEFPAAFRGNYFFLDHARGWVCRVVLDAGNAVVSVDLPWATTEASGWGYGPVDMILGNDGTLYYTQYTGGKVRRILYAMPASAGAGADALELAPPAPNPAAGTVTLRFTLAKTGRARLEILDAQGRRVRALCEGTLAAGPQAARWDGADARGLPAPPGVYLARLEAGGRTLTQRLALVR